jgi:tetratricopeptide (TPR) repeat protein
VLFEQGTLHYLERQYATAERVYREAIALHAANGGDARMQGKLAHDLAVVLEASGRHAEAREAYEQAVAAIEAAFGPDHPEFSRVLHDHATMLLVQGELDAAAPMLARCLDIDTHAFGSTHHLVGRTHISLTELALRRGTFTEAVAHAGTAARIYREALPDDHPGRVDAEVALGTARFFAGELESALDAFLAARELQRRAPSVDPLALAITVNDIAETQVALSRFTAASATFTEVEQLLARAGARDLDLEARVLTGRGKIALAEGDRVRALPLLEAAVDLRRRIPDDPLALAELQEALTRARNG